MVGEVPAVAWFSFIAQDIELVIAEHTLRDAAHDELTHKENDARTVRTAITQVADKDQAPAAAMFAVLVIAQLIEQIAQRQPFAVHVTNNIQWAIEQRLQRSRYSVPGGGHGKRRSAALSGSRRDRLRSPCRRRSAICQVQRDARLN